MKNKKLFVNTYDTIISVENLLLAYREFKGGKKDKPDVQQFEYKLMENILGLHQELKEKTYKHGDYKGFKINDPKPRDIHKASVRDRVLHHAIYRILSPFYCKLFIVDSYSCQVGKGYT
jgi:RNA-directed DNA polymerase